MEKEYKTQCRDMEVLLWESRLTPAPDEGVWTFEPKENDLALVGGVEYIFTSKREWIKNDNK